MSVYFNVYRDADGTTCFESHPCEDRDDAIWCHHHRSKLYGDELGEKYWFTLIIGEDTVSRIDLGMAIGEPLRVVK